MQGSRPLSVLAANSDMNKGCLRCHKDLNSGFHIEEIILVLDTVNKALLQYHNHFQYHGKD